MTDHSAEFGKLHDDATLHLHSLSSRFESAWQSDTRPQISAFLTDVPPSDVPALLELLLPIDVRCRRLRGEQPSPADYGSLEAFVTGSELQVLLESACHTDRPEIEITVTGAGRTTPGLSSADLLQRLRDSEIVSAEVLTEFTEDTAPEEIGHQLLERGLLTAFQLQNLTSPTDLPSLLGDYVLLDQIGQGGMGTVLRAEHRRMKRIVAIKILRQQTFQDHDSIQRFTREVELAARLSHPNIVTAYDAGEQDGLLYLVTEYIDGENLADIVRHQGPFCLEDGVSIACQAATGLQYAHSKGIIHRDIKPANLLLDDEGGVKLLDVGLARLIHEPAGDDSEATELTASGMIMGTVNYMSPEQASNTHEANELSDLYSLGCTLWFLLTGAPPYADGSTMERLIAHREQPIPSLRDLNPDVPEQLDNICRGLLAKVPAERPKSAEHVCDELNRLLQHPLPDLTLTAAAADGMDATIQATQLNEDHPKAHRSDDAVPLVTPVRDSPDSGTARPRRKPSAMIPLLSIILPGIVAVMLVMWWFGRDRTTPATPPDEVISNQSDPPADSLPQLTDFSIDQVRDWRHRRAAADGLPLTERLNDMTFELIPPGRFLAGSGETRQIAEVRDAFYLATTEVTVGQFRQFMDSTDHETVTDGWGWNGTNWDRQPDWGWDNPGEHDISEQHPAASIRYTDAVAFCAWMSEQTGRTVRLPSETEWEYACRCGRAGTWSFGDRDEDGDAYAWTANQSGNQLQPVGELQPNAWGLYDMHGNESEWCTSDAADVGPDEAVVRGGGFNAPLHECTSSSRLVRERTDPSHGAFRLVLEP